MPEADGDLGRRAQVEALIDVVNRRDFGGLARLGYRDDTEFHSIVARTEGEFYVGIDGLRQWGAMVDETWSDFRITLLDVVDAPGRRAVVLLRLSGTARGSGVPLDASVAQVWQWHEDGSMLRNVAYSEQDEARRAAGL